MLRSTVGSSPLTRGKRGVLLRALSGPGLIPAHAGKTRLWELAPDGAAAHPRSRGENHVAPPCLILGAGSSPLTRGKLEWGKDGAFGDRLIPAHAGKTLSRRARRLRRAAHPRSRGENRFSRQCDVPMSGSSPLTRGKRCAEGERIGIARLIPAHAGKTDRWHHLAGRARAHPRSRGENCLGISAVVIVCGSSPLTRGKLNTAPALARARRLIPAHAGKTRRQNPGSRKSQAHPRSRGENAVGCSLASYYLGSSPLTRGKRPR